ncbi:MAG: methyltransferase [Alphaproteobacteria bacterium]|nr:methyltransferase [Alphaproteobacteria bacterium]
MAEALCAWMDAMGRTGDAERAVTSAAEAVASSPWRVVQEAGALARCQAARADRDLGLTAELAVVGVDSARAVVRVGAGQPFPLVDRAGSRRRGAFDTPRAMARRLACLTGGGRRGVDPACGTGALLLAMAEQGVDELAGQDIDPLALAVARVAVPGASLRRGDAFEGSPEGDLLLTNPPFVSPEHQDKELRRRLTAALPWLSGRFDLAVPFLALALGRLPQGAVAGVVSPASLLFEPYGAPLRRRWLAEDRLRAVGEPERFPGVGVRVALLALERGGGPASLPWAGGPHASEVLRLETAPLDPRMRAGDVDLVEAARARAVELGALCEVDTGLVAHGPGGGKARLLCDGPGEGIVPFVDARDLFAGRVRWLRYDPDRMHRPKRPGLFEGPKILVQRLRGDRPVAARVDRTGLYAGHTLTVVRPLDQRVPIERLCALLTHPVIAGLLRVEGGGRLDLYPRPVRRVPVPKAWLEDPTTPLPDALGLTRAQAVRLADLAPG